MKRWLSIFAVTALIAASAAAQTEAPPSGPIFDRSDDYAPDVAAGLKIGTLGPGMDVTISLVPTLNLRLNGNYLKWSFDRTIDDVDYEVELDINSLMAMLDWHPFDNNFRLTAGGIRNGSESTLDGTPTKNVTIGDHEYTPAQIGTLTGKLEFEDLAPYLGVGFGNAVGPETTFSFIFDLGVIFQTFEVDLSASGPVAKVPRFQSDLRKEESDIQDDLDDLTVYPVLSFGVAYRFF